MTYVMVCPFDPITEEEIRYANRIVKEKHIHTLFLMPYGKGILSPEERIHLLEVAVKPYRHLAVTASISKDDDVLYMEGCAIEEEAVRHGEFVRTLRSVRRELNRNGWYYEEIARYMCNSHRYTHSLGVANTAKKLAAAHGLDEKQAYRAGLLHDVTKAWSDEEAKEIIRLYRPEWLNLSAKIWHSYTAVVWCRQNMDLNDTELLHAIEHHTVGDGTGSLDRILYIADKIEPGRGYDTTKQMKTSLKNLKDGAELILHQRKEYIYKKEGIHV